MISSAIIFSALELGFIYALVALALFLSFRVLNIADMTTDGAFTLGCAVSATFAVAGHPLLGIPAAMLAGACAGGVTAFLQTKLNIPSILAGIITNTGLYTVNLADFPLRLCKAYKSSLVFLARYSGRFVIAPSLRYPLRENRKAYLG